MSDDLDREIAEFRSTHNEALYSKAHADHDLRSSELSALYERRFPMAAEVATVDGDQAANLPLVSENLPTPADQPPKQSDYDFSALPVPVGVETVEDKELEGYAREWLTAGEVDPMEARALAVEYAESLGKVIGPEQAEYRRQGTEQSLRAIYRADYDAAVAAASVVVSEQVGLYDFLERSNLINSERVISNLIKIAEKRGLFKRTGA
jgi:hypothetical protein